jgi:hypothetical protein
MQDVQFGDYWVHVDYAVWVYVTFKPIYMDYMSMGTIGLSWL